MEETKGWKEKALSKTGREVLIKSVMQLIPKNIMGCFQLPQSLCDETERMIVRFSWRLHGELKASLAKVVKINKEQK